MNIRIMATGGLFFIAAAAQAAGDCTGGLLIDSGGNECMTEPVVPAPTATPVAATAAVKNAPAWRSEIKELTFVVPRSKADRRVAATRVAPATPHAAAAVPGEPDRCAGNSDATGNAC